MDDVPVSLAELATVAAFVAWERVVPPSELAGLVGFAFVTFCAGCLLMPPGYRTGQSVLYS